MAKPLLTLILIFLLASAHAETKGVELQFHIPSSVTIDSTQTYVELVRDFELLHPNIKINLLHEDSYDKVLNTVMNQASKKRASGVFVAEISELLTLKYASAIIPLDDFLKNHTPPVDSYLEKFLPAFLENSFDDHGRLYALPIFRSTPLIYYNLDKLERVGYSYEQLPTTWEELEVLLKKLYAFSNETPLGLANTWYDWIFESFVRQNGGSLTNSLNTQVKFDSKPVVEALKFWQELFQSKLMARSPGSWKDAIYNFVTQQNYAIIYYSSSGISVASKHANFRWASSVMPSKEKFAASVGAGNVFVSNYLTEDQKVAAWTFLRYLTEPETQAKISFHTGYFPVIKKAYATEILAQRYNFRPYKNALKQLEYAEAKMMTRDNKWIRQILKTAIDRSLDDMLPANESLKHAQILANNRLAPKQVEFVKYKKTEP